MGATNSINNAGARGRIAEREATTHYVSFKIELVTSIAILKWTQNTNIYIYIYICIRKNAILKWTGKI